MFRQFPARVPELNTTEFNQLKSQFADMEPGLGRSATNQAAFQMYALLTTLAVAIVGGLLTGKRERFKVIYGAVNYRFRMLTLRVGFLA